MSASDTEKFQRAIITKRVDLTPELWMIRIQPNGEFKFAPGQYATLGIDGPNKRTERPYSIVSAPHESELEFFFELVPPGDLTPLLYKLNPATKCSCEGFLKGASCSIPRAATPITF